MQRFYYCVVFDNDPDLPGVVQFVKMFDGETITGSLKEATEVYNDRKKDWPSINYTIMKTNLIPVENV